MDPSISNFKSFTQRVISELKENLKSIRTGRANPAIVENIIAEVYGGSTKLKIMELATITTEGPSTIVVAPFDPSTTADIERAILKSPLGITPQSQGTRLLLRVPPMSQEQREKVSKVIGVMIEEKKVMIRNERDESRKRIKSQLEKKELTEDDKYRMEKDIDTITQDAMGEIETIKESKQKEIMEV